MGRFPNIAAAKAKTGAAKGKLYGMYAKEIYQAAKNGGVTPEGNPALKRLIEKAKKEQVPGDVIKRAIDKVNSGAGEDYETLKKEGLVYECEAEMNADMDLDVLKRIVFAKSTGLTEKQIECMTAHYGLDGNEPLSMVKIAEARGITRMEVYHLIGAALIKIRRDISKKANKAKISNILESGSSKFKR